MPENNTLQNSNLRVALVSRFPADIDHPRGGVETATLNLALALKSLGTCELSVITLEKGRNRSSVEQVSGIEVHRLPRSNWPMVLDVFIGPSSRTLRAYIESLNLDVVHFHESWGLGCADLTLPHVFTVHGFDSLNLPTERAWGWRIRQHIWRLAEAFGLRDHKHLISIAPYVTEEIRKQTEAKTYEIWNALPAKLFDIARQEVDGKVLFLGWLNHRKNPLGLVESAAMIRDMHPEMKIILAGDSPDPVYRAKLQSRIVDLGMQEKISLPGRLSQSEVQKELSEATMLVLPSLQENAPMVVAEAMAMGVPVVASEVCGIPDMLDAGESGILIDPLDSNELAGAMERLLGDVSERQRLSDQGRKSAYKKFHPESVAKQTLEVYRHIASTNDTIC